MKSDSSELIGEGGGGWAIVAVLFGQDELYLPTPLQNQLLKIKVNKMKNYWVIFINNRHTHTVNIIEIRLLKREFFNDFFSAHPIQNIFFFENDTFRSTHHHQLESFK